MRFSIRLLAYTLIFLFYIAFMEAYAPMGIFWLDWHGQRIYNAVEFLRLNGYLNYLGFTIWDSCQNCSLDANSWKESLYLSKHAISLFPYILINHFGGKEYLLAYGPIFDHFVIFLCSCLIAELISKSLNNISNLPIFFIATISFSLFLLSPWTYKMLIASWTTPYFLILFLFGLISFDNSKFLSGCFFFMLAGLFNYQFAAAIAVFYFLIFVIGFLLKKDLYIYQYFPGYFPSSHQQIQIISSLALPTLFILISRIVLFESHEIMSSSGSSLLFRIGISGNDIHNGGILGALQFLGGNRVTQCLAGATFPNLSADLSVKIEIFNCILSTFSMSIVSVISIFGAYFLIKKSQMARNILLPLAFSLVLFISILQQSLSVHLMGYSFIFSALYSAGLVYVISSTYEKIASQVLGLVFAIPSIFALLLLSIRVSMLTGSNG